MRYAREGGGKYLQKSCCVIYVLPPSTLRKIQNLSYCLDSTNGCLINITQSYQVGVFHFDVYIFGPCFDTFKLKN
jgi:hypothetical protein